MSSVLCSDLIILHFVRLQTLYTRTVFEAYQQLSFTQKQKKFETREYPTLGIASPILSHCPENKKTRESSRL